MWEDLERDPALVLEVAGERNRGHAALADFALDPVAVGEGGGEAGGVIRHGCCGVLRVIEEIAPDL